MSSQQCLSSDQSKLFGVSPTPGYLDTLFYQQHKANHIIYTETTESPFSVPS